ncbi:MAG: patatin-like phospholipase family protein [Polyangiaceae bacterium]|nr:patatin-like phospholipase family protein [Polyangiaceae bacterium]
MTSTASAKSILYYGPSRPQFDRLMAAMRRAPGCDPVVGDATSFQHGTLRCRWLPRLDTDELLDDLQRRYVNLVVLDLRCAPAELGARAERAVGALRALDRSEEIENRFAFHRTLVLVSGVASAALDAVILELGALGVGCVLRETSTLTLQGGPAEGEVAFAAELASEAERIMVGRRRGQRALCCAGGGISGIFFELGALKCLDDCLPDGGVNRFDLYFGISAGAVVNGPLANGYSVDEFMAAIAGAEGGRIPRLDMRLLRMIHFDLPGFVRRFFHAGRNAASSLWGALAGRSSPSVEQLLFDCMDIVAPPFRGDGFEKMLRDILTVRGATNDFRRLTRHLYVGATDQDEREHVLFGDEANDEVPISLAIQASLSLNPAFSATRIRGRYYEDGAVTRTTNFVEAIRRGATLIVVLDPFVPYVARTAGFSNRRGLLYNVDQNVRTISHTRYEMSRNWVLRRHPEVSAYTFVPANRLRRTMSLNPMDHRPYLEIWRGAYLSTLQRLRRLAHRLVGDFQAHGFAIDLARAEAVGAQLLATPAPTFADFFPDRKIAIRRPPLALEAAARRKTPLRAVPRASPPGLAPVSTAVASERG